MYINLEIEIETLVDTSRKNICYLYMYVQIKPLENNKFIVLVDILVYPK